MMKLVMRNKEREEKKKGRGRGRDEESDDGEHNDEPGGNNGDGDGHGGDGDHNDDYGGDGGDHDLDSGNNFYFLLLLFFQTLVLRGFETQTLNTNPCVKTFPPLNVSSVTDEGTASFHQHPLFPGKREALHWGAW